MTDEWVSRIDAMIAEIKRHKVEPRFGEEIAEREAFSLEPFRQPSDFLRLLCHLIAYSQQAPAAAVKVALPILDRAFSGFDPKVVAEMDPEDIIRRFRDRLGALRFIPTKIRAMVQCGRVVRDIDAEFGTPLDYVKSFGLLEQLKASEDVPRFWLAFDALLADLTRREIRFFGKTTSLCHLLMVMGFPCNKPDRVVMNVASALGIVRARKTHSDAELRQVVRAIQEYSVIRATRPGLVDLYFLIRGRQTGVETTVRQEYYSELEPPPEIEPRRRALSVEEALDQVPPQKPGVRHTTADESDCVNARRWRARPATVTIGDTVIEGTVVDESDDRAVIFMPWGGSAEYFPFRIARESVCVHPWNSPHARVRAFRQVAEAVLGRHCWLRVQTIASTQGNAQERVTEIGRIFFGDNWARHYVPQHVFEEEVLRMRQTGREPVQMQRTGLLLVQATKVRR